jgi:hypothetical protein
MKTVSFLLRAASVSGAAFLFGLVFNAHALGFFITTAAISVLLIAAHDYAPPRLRPAIAAPSRIPRRRYTLPLAA